VDYDKSVQKLLKWSDAYYNGEAIASDDEYDKLYREIRSFEKAADLPSRIETVSNGTGKGRVPHIPRMWSMSNVYNFEELEKWVKSLPETEFLLLPKYDGLALSIVIEDGEIVNIVTRGNGYEGESVMRHHDNIDNLPDAADSVIGKLRGELCITKGSFERINEEAVKNNSRVYSNPRNTVSGLMTKKKIPEDIRLVFCPWGYVTNKDNGDFNTLEEQYEYITTVVGSVFRDAISYAVSASDIESIYHKMIQSRFGRDIDIDGLVISVNDVLTQDLLGYNEKDPKWRMAYKFPALEKTTILRDITNQVGKYGTITPVGLIVPIEIDGVTISKVTLHNYRHIERLGLMKGDTVIVIRSGDVIPKLISVLKDRRSGDEKVIGTPTFCPACKGPVREVGPTIECESEFCQAKIAGRMAHHVSREALDIRGLGPSLIDRLIERGFSTLYDIHTVTLEALLEIDGVEMKTATNIIKAIENVRGNVTLSKFIYSLGIRNVGRRASKKIAGKFGYGYVVSDKNALKISGLNRNAIDSYTDFMRVFGEDTKRLENLVSPRLDDESKKKKVCVTGKLSIPKKLFYSDFDMFDFVDTVSNEIDYLVYSDTKSSKYDKATRLGKTTFTEEEFRKTFGN